jgi:hypothetical protein
MKMILHSLKMLIAAQLRGNENHDVDIAIDNMKGIEFAEYRILSFTFELFSPICFL